MLCGEQCHTSQCVYNFTLVNHEVVFDRFAMLTPNLRRLIELYIYTTIKVQFSFQKYQVTII